MEWWRTAVIYQVYPRSFADANGDGVGDLPGITARLEHLADLGVDALWLSPFYRSPMVDGGYDVADYCDVDPVFGTLADFDALLERAHALGLRVIVDIVPNHTSSAHPWFVNGLFDRYVRADRPNGWQSLFGGPAWTQLPDGSWYLHLFDPAQPDLNWDNQDVRDEFREILHFWLRRGVDGFRVDVAHGLVKPDVAEASVFDQEGVHEIYRDWRKILDSYPGERMAVAEVFDTTPDRVARYVAADELHQAFNFDFLEAPWEADELRRIIDASLAAAAAVGAPPTWVISNHDRRRPVTRFGDGVSGRRRARAAALLMLGLPGSAYIYQGEELGLPEVLDLPDDVRTDPQFIRSGGAELGRDGCRVPLPWAGDAPPFGFGARSWLPQPADWAAFTVAAQRADPDSTLNLYRSALRLRRPAATLTWRPAPDGVLCFETEQLLVAANLGDSAFTLPREPVLASSPVGGTLPPDTTVWMERG
ncbi:glycoside hydrolase family 13 protein [Dactylosporangium matsuzakiense]|uniref:Alpha-glucosidase n=1 Tax=Dactylosporangium matsuzakiense TaxID=53360 RepID=A0A9W6KNR6_9ACTN|nr:glycoside hydrolase family 13 protein [Dactylosporangium matsuzakiense]GLL04009.1 alpha-glucosidase [Dactylosporangium matsuzakiense]